MADATVKAIDDMDGKQRAVLILRDVLGWSARETAAALGSTVAAANSALQRARSSLERARGNLAEIRLVPTAANRQPALAAYARDPGAGVYRAYGVMVFAFKRGEIAGIVGVADAALFGRFGLPTVVEE